MDPFVAIPLMLLLLCLKGFFSGSEIALINADKVRLRHRAKKGNKGAALVLAAFRRPEELLSTTLIGTNIATIALTTIGTLMMIELFGAVGDLYAFLILTPILLIFGEIVPKSVMQDLSDRVTPVIIYPLRLVRTVLHPVIVGFSWVARLIARAAGIRSADSGLFMTREQLSAVVDIAEKSASFAAFDKGRIRTVLRFAQSTVGEVMVPMAEVTGINADHDMAEAIVKARGADINRMPVYKDIASNVVGVARLESWDLMDPSLDRKPLSTVTHPAQYLSPLQTVQEVIPILSGRQDRMAVVVDEYGSAIGIVTLEDIIGKVVGDVNVGFDTPEGGRTDPGYRFEKLGTSSYLFDARYPLSEVNEVLGLSLPQNEFHTLGGLISGRLRHLADVGEGVSEAGCRFTVIQATSRAPTRIQVDLLDR